MRLNKKGMSLMELLVTIVLIGIVLAFIFQLLVDLRNERDNNNFAHNNQVNRIEIMHTIGDDLNKFVLQSIVDASSGGNLTINFNFRDADATRTATLQTYSNTKDGNNEYYVQYISFNRETHTWKMQGAEIDPCGLFDFYRDNKSSKYYFKLNIFVYNKPYHERNNAEVNNAVDDLEITGVGYTSELKNISNGLTNSAIENKKIGSCTK